MEQKINIAELLKDCSRGMELDCAIFNDVTLYRIDTSSENEYPIRIETKNGNLLDLTKYGTYSNVEESKCVIYPKGKTSWEGFQRPFKDGDILSYQCQGYKNRTIYIYMQHSKLNTTYYVALSGYSNSEFIINHEKEQGWALNGYNDTVRLATEEEKQKLFDAIKENGYKWNAETKTLEKLVKPKFKVGDEIVKQNSICNSWIISSVSSEYYGLKSPNGIEGIGVLPVSGQDEYELVPNKFDINTLIPFESRVLMRSSNAREWTGTIYSHYNNNYFFGCGMMCQQCIPYEGNEHLLGTTADCDEFYKNW